MWASRRTATGAGGNISRRQKVDSNRSRGQHRQKERT
jgi:hypothetical protein